MDSARKPHDTGGAQPEPWQEPVSGGFPESSLFLSSGIDQLRAMIADRCPRPPVSHLTGMRLIEAGAGSATFNMPASAWLASPQGAIANARRAGGYELTAAGRALLDAPSPLHRWAQRWDQRSP